MRPGGPRYRAQSTRPETPLDSARLGSTRLDSTPLLLSLTPTSLPVHVRPVSPFTPRRMARVICDDRPILPSGTNSSTQSSHSYILIVITHRVPSSPTAVVHVPIITLPPPSPKKEGNEARKVTGEKRSETGKGKRKREKEPNTTDRTNV